MIVREEFVRSAMLLTPEGIKRLAGAHVAVFGLGGVGSYAAEALVRTGIGELTVVDNDRVSLSNLNRQLIALHSTVGKLKTEAFATRARDINMGILLHLRTEFVLPENIDTFDFADYDFVIDAVDTVAAKLAIVKASGDAGVPIISAMGTGNKLNPSGLQICDISKTTMCPLARIMRTELRKRGITSLLTIYSPEQPLVPLALTEQEKRATPGSLAFVPGVAGLMAAGEVVRRLAFDMTQPVC